MALFGLLTKPKPEINAGVEACARTPDAVLLDVRTREEYAAGHIGGSRNLPLELLPAAAPRELPDRGAPLYVYCRSGGAADCAAALLKADGVYKRDGYRRDRRLSGKGGTVNEGRHHRRRGGRRVGCGAAAPSGRAGGNRRARADGVYVLRQLRAALLHRRRHSRRIGADAANAGESMPASASTCGCGRRRLPSTARQRRSPSARSTAARATPSATTSSSSRRARGRLCRGCPASTAPASIRAAHGGGYAPHPRAGRRRRQRLGRNRRRRLHRRRAGGKSAPAGAARDDCRKAAAAFGTV